MSITFIDGVNMSSLSFTAGGTVDVLGGNRLEYGTIKTYSDKDSYGFIQRDDGGGDVFLHYSTIRKMGIDERQVQEGVRVTFETKPDPGRNDRNHEF